MNKRILTIIIVALVVLSGCGKKNIDASHNEDENIAVIEQTTDETVNDDETAFVTEENTEEIEESIQDTQEEIVYSDDEQKIPIDGVVNNNAYFVQVDGKIYFHVVDADSMDKTALWANYVPYECGRTVLFEYDPVTDEATPIAYDYSSGKIGVNDNALYFEAYSDSSLSEYGDPENRVDGYALDGKTLKGMPVVKQDFLGVSPDGSFVATHKYEYSQIYDNNEISIYRYGKIRDKFQLDDYYDFVALGNNDIFYISRDEIENDFFLMRLNIDNGKITKLGLLPKFDYSDWGGNVDQCEIVDNRIYLSYSLYEGTGHFFSQGFFVIADIDDVGDSLEYHDMNNYPGGELHEGEEWFTPFAVIEGELVISDGIPGTCEVKDDMLGYYDNEGEWVPVVDGYGYTYYDDDNYRAVEQAELVGDSIYLYYNDNIRAPEDDIGWRYAYYRHTTDVIRVDIKTGEATTLVHQVGPWGE